MSNITQIAPNLTPADFINQRTVVTVCIRL